MRVSSYLFGAKIPQQNAYVIAHGYTGAIDKIGLRVGQILLELRGKILPDNIDISTDLIGTLRKRGYVTDLTHSQEVSLLKELSAEIHAHDLETRPVSFSIIPSYACNLRCPYCFQPHKMHSTTGPFGRAISNERIEQVFSIIDDVRGNRSKSQNSNLHITLFGGEPLSRHTVHSVGTIVDAIRARGGSLSAITNGLELDLFTDILGKELKEVQITLDGLAELNDKRRTGPEFRATFDTICRNIELALSRSAEVQVRINADAENIDQLLPLNEMFKSKGWSANPNFQPSAAVVHSAGKRKQPETKRPITHLELLRATLDLRESDHSSIGSYEGVVETFIQQAVFGKGYAFQSVASCSAETGQLMFDPYGQVFSCWEDVGCAEFKVADYDVSGIHYIGNGYSEWLSRSPDKIHNCSECQYALIHKSGCGQHARTRTGSILNSECESFKLYFPEAFGRLYAEFERNIIR